MSGAVNRLTLVAAGILLAIAAVVTVLIAPDRSQLVFFVESGGANEVVVPVGYWGAVTLWAGVAAWLTDEAPSRMVPRAIGVGFALHVLLLLADFSPRLVDPAAFSAPSYRTYGRLFCAVVLMLATAWVIRSLRRPGMRVTEFDLFDVPVVAGAVVFASSLFRFDPLAGGLGIAGGLFGSWLTSSTSRSVSEAYRLWRQLADDERLLLLTVFLAAFGLRLLYLQRVMTDPNYVATGGDGPVYDQLAWSIARGDGIPDSFKNGYPLLLLGYVRFAGAVYALAGHSYFVLCAIQAALGAFTCVILYAIAKPLFGVPPARVAAVFTALSFPLLFAAAAIGHQAVDVFVTVLLVWLLCRAIAVEHSPLWQWVGIGVVVGCAIAVRETNAFFLIFVVAWVFWAFHRSRRRGAVRVVGAVMVGSAIVLAPLVVPMIASAESRLRLRQHFDRLYTGQGDAVRTRADLAGPLENPGAAIGQLRERPAFVVVTMARAIVHNFAVQFFTQPFGGFDLVFLGKGSRYYYAMWFYAYALACAGLVIAARRLGAGDLPAAAIALVLGTMVSRTLPHLFLESHYRHRVPIEPFLILMASVAAVGLMESIHTGPASRRQVA